MEYKEELRVATFSGAVYKSCLVARGKMAGYFEAGVSGHDMAAVQVIIKESGGKITDYNGKDLDYTKPFSGAVISNGLIHDKLLECLRV